jgi:eukaryotic-like serine/threonine-protein kinase
MGNLFTYLKSKVFFKHLLFAIFSLIVVLWLMFRYLNTYTHHGETAEVPEFTGKSIAELDQFINGKNVRYQIIDSIYDPNEKAGIVIRQEPDAKSFVKHNRLIYLYVTSTQPPQIEMPKLVDKSVRQATFMIESYGLKVGKIIEVKGDCNGCVLRQLYNDKVIETGALIKKSSKIDLEVGKMDVGYTSTADSTEVELDE